MKFFHKTTKYRMSMIVILALLLQMITPVVSSYSFAAEDKASPDLGLFYLDMRSTAEKVEVGQTFEYEIEYKLNGIEDSIDNMIIEINLPEAIKFDNAIELTEDMESYYYDEEDNKLTFIFKDGVNGDKNGTASFSAKYSKDMTLGEIETEVIAELKVDGELKQASVPAKTTVMSAMDEENTQKTSPEKESANNKDEKKEIKELKVNSSETIKDDKNELRLQNNDTTNIELDHYGAKDQKLYPRHLYTTNVKVNISGKETNLENHAVLLEINHMDLRNINISSPSLAGEHSIYTKNGKTYIKIPFQSLRGGTSFDFPITFQVQKGIVPEGFITTIKTTLVDPDGNFVLGTKSEELSFETIYQKFQVEKQIEGNPSSGQSIWGGTLDKDGTFIPGTEAVVIYNYELKNYTKDFDFYYRNYNKVTITDTLPEGAHFDPELNPGWTLSSDGKTATYTLEAPASHKTGNPGNYNGWFGKLFHDVQLKLTFPGSKKNDSFENKVDVQFHQQHRADSEPDHITSDTVSHVFDGSAAGIFDKLAGSTYGRASTIGQELKQIKDMAGDKRQDHDWYLAIKNPGQFPMKDVVVEDYLNDGKLALDERLRFTKISLEEPEFINNVKAIYKYTDRNGTKVEVAGSNGVYDLGDDAVGYRVEFTTLPAQMPTKFFKVTSVMDDYNNVSYDKDNDNNNLLFNTAVISADFDTGDTGISMSPVKGTVRDRFVLLENNESIRVTKSRGNISQVISEGSRVTFILRVYYDELDLARKLDNVRIVDLLPLGLDPIESKDVRYSGVKNYKNYDYEVVENYQNSGRTAYVFNLGDKEVEDLVDEYPAQWGSPENPNYFEIIVEAKANKLASIYNTNEFFFVYDGEQVPISDSNKVKDIWDLNNNGETDDEILRATEPFPFNYSKEVLSSKFINDNENKAWGFARDLAEGQTFNYRLNVLNNSEDDMEQLILYDVLPHIGDKSTVPNQSGQYADRGSEIVNTMTGPIQVPDGFTAYYLTDKPNGTASEVVRNANWQTSVADYSQVKAIKIVMNEGKIFKPAEEVNAIVPMKAPVAWESNEKYGVNTYAISVDGGEIFDESNAVKNRVYQDPVTPGIKKDVNGEEAKEAVRIAKGKEFNYNIKTTVPADVAGHSEDEFTDLTLTDILDDRLEVVGAKVFVDGKESTALVPRIDKQTVTLRLDRDQLLAHAGKEVNLQITSKIKANVEIEVIDNKASIQLNDNPSEDSNTVKVVPPPPETPEIEKDVEGKEHLDVDRNKEYNYNVKINIPSDVKGYETLVISDTLDNRLDVVGAKVLVDGKVVEGLKPVITEQTVKLELTKEQIVNLADKEVNLQITAKVKDDTKIEIIDNKANIKLNDNPSVDSNVVTVEPNPYAKLEITKVEDGTNTVLKGATFELLDKDGKVFTTVTTDKNGKAVIDNIPLGDYKLKETVAPEGYVLDRTEHSLTLNKDKLEQVFTHKLANKKPTTPSIKKDVEGKEHLEIVKGKEYNYNVKTNIPTDVSGYVDLTIEDTLDNRLDVLSAKVLINGQESTNLEASIDGQNVTLDLNKEQIESLAGKEVNLQITAKIKIGTEIETIENKANIKLNDNPSKESNVVTVVPPEPTTPNIKKDVEGKEHLEIAKGEKYNYNIKTNIPEDLGGYKTLTIKDVLDKRLEVVGTKIFVDGKEAEFEVTIDGQTVTLTLDRQQLESVAGKELTLQITAKINEDAKIELIENKATIQLNDNPEVDSNVVTVIPPKPEKPIKPGTPDKSSKPTKSGSLEKSLKLMLPKTGSGSNILYYSIGLILLLIGILIKRRNTNHN